ncbi:helix-turn-helix transcriptional regulator [uncultured Sphingomonas sp.]|uniref:helix-turn-helix domain-containing protein n=1 Tax=uncultured Sphingomonas sp. TaxID=158754 RepID=UPI00260636D8|nr:helix-turn-helix transcriptional regulator [uncultured Sphingomonas sp.]
MITPDQCRAARALLGWSAQQVADAGGIGIATVKRFESGQSVQDASVERVKACLEVAGIRFLVEGQSSPKGGAGVRLA